MMNKNFFNFTAGILVSAFVLVSCNKDDAPDTLAQEPGSEQVFTFFKEINAVPRPSRHEEKMREYLKNFASVRGLRCTEESGNIIIYKDASKGMESAPGICLQTHMDMVCAAAEGYEIDFLTQGIEQEVEGDIIHSKEHKTSLGADDGIGMSMVLSVLDNSKVVHGPLECLFTWNEEDGMDGAEAFPTGVLNSSYFINVDGEDEGMMCVGTAGGVVLELELDAALTVVPSGFTAMKLLVNGLSGGHSGLMITLGGANANKVLGNFLGAYEGTFRLAGFQGGTFTNVIASSAQCLIVVPEAEKTTLEQQFLEYMAKVKIQYAATDPEMNYAASQVALPSSCLSEADSKLIAEGLAKAPHGVTEWSTTISGAFENSLNLGIVKMENGKIEADYFVRGFTKSKMDALAEVVENAWKVGASAVSCEHTGAYSAWNPSPDTPFFAYAQRIYRERFGKELVLLKVGAGLELSQFSEKYPDMQFITIGPTIHDAHTVNESLEISSVKACWKYLLAMLKEILLFV